MLRGTKENDCTYNIRNQNTKVCRTNPHKRVGQTPTRSLNYAESSIQEKQADKHKVCRLHYESNRDYLSTFKRKI